MAHKRTHLQTRLCTRHTGKQACACAYIGRHAYTCTHTHINSDRRPPPPPPTQTHAHLTNIPRESGSKNPKTRTNTKQIVNRRNDKRNIVRIALFPFRSVSVFWSLFLCLSLSFRLCVGGRSVRTCVILSSLKNRFK